MTGSSLDPLPPEFSSVGADSPENTHVNCDNAVEAYLKEAAKIAREQTAPVADKTSPKEQNNRRKSITFEELKADLEKTGNYDEESVFNKLNKRTTVEKFSDLNRAILSLGDKSNEKKLDNRFREPIKSYLGAITPLCIEKNKDGHLARIPKKAMPYLTELTFRLIFKTIYPDHNENNRRGRALAIEIARLYKKNLLGALNTLAISASSVIITCNFHACHKNGFLLWKSYQDKENQTIASCNAKKAFDIQSQTNGSQSSTEHSPTLRTKRR